MHQLMQMRLANPASQHAAGRQARKVVEEARESILRSCGARVTGMASDQLIFTSGGTEANNLALFGLAEQRPGSIVVSSIEHPSVLASAERLQSLGRTIYHMPCRQDGTIDVDSLEQRIATESIAVVSLMAANNETGVIQNIERVAEVCSNAGVWLHTDAVQAIGKVPLEFAKLNVDAMTITAHKLHGPVGIGALILRNGIMIAPQLFGGFQQLGLRPGTENAILAAGFAAATSEAKSQRDVAAVQMESMRDRLEQIITSRISRARVVGRESQRLPHTSSIAFDGLDRQALQLALDQLGVACSTGSACASGSSQPSHVLLAMGLNDSLVRGGVRFSLSRETTPDEIDRAGELIVSAVERLSKIANLVIPRGTNSA